MSLETAAKHLASKGRGPDTQLVHLSLGELNSLQELAKAHGGSLSINPDTGLPEAGFLSNILPMVLGAGLTAATGGALSPLMLGLGVGGVQAMRTGDLGQGLMAGLGAYGGAGLAGSFMNAGTGALSQAAGTAGASAVTPVAAEAGLTQGAADIGNVYAQEQAAQNAIANKLAAATPMETAKAGLGQIANNPSQFFNKGNLRYGLAAAAPAFAETKTEMPKVDSAPTRFAYTPGRRTDPTAGYPTDYRGEYSYFEPRFTRMAEGGSTDEYKYAFDPATGTYKKIEPPAEEMQPQMPQTQLPGSDGGSMAQAGQPGRSGGMNPATTIGIGQALQGYGQLGFAPGALAAGLIGDAVVNSGINQLGAMESAAAQASADHAANTAANEAGISAAFGNSDSSHAGSDHGAGIDSSGMYNMGGITALARGGYSHLGDYSDGGRLLRGPGDGVSDSIPATIANKRPARLADGEFVIPARIVSELGNGSTEAGARKLYAMMDRVQRARGKTTGKGKVAKDTRSDKYLPA